MAISKIGKDKYEVRLRIGNGQIRRRFDDKFIAQDFEQYVVKDGLSPDHAFYKAYGFDKPKDVTQIRFKKFCEEVWLPGRTTGLTTANELPTTKGTARSNAVRASHVYPFIGSRYLVDLNAVDWQELKFAFRTQPLNNGKLFSISSAKKILDTAKQIVRYAVQINYLKTDPWAYVKLIPAPKIEKDFWRPEQCSRFLDALAEDDSDYYLYFLIALHTAMRKSEIFGLQKGDIDLENGLINVRRQWDTDAYEHESPRRIAYKSVLKNGATFKTIPMTDTLRRELSGKLSTIIGDQTHLFYFPVKFMKFPGAVLRIYAKRAGVPVIKAHGTRDSAIGNLKRAGVSDRLIAQIAGCTVANLDSYGHLDQRDVTEVVKVLDRR